MRDDGERCRLCNSDRKTLSCDEEIWSCVEEGVGLRRLYSVSDLEMMPNILSALEVGWREVLVVYVSAKDDMDLASFGRAIWQFGGKKRSVAGLCQSTRDPGGSGP